MKENSRFKFRAWDYESERWVYGYYTKLVEGIRKYDAIVSEDGGSLVRYYIDDIKTLGQYTGLKDLNGKEIYEGDIISQISSDGEEIVHIIGYENYEARFVAYFKRDYNTDMSFCGLIARWTDRKEVIGNIFENPELLEDKQ